MYFGAPREILGACTCWIKPLHVLSPSPLRALMALSRFMSFSSKVHYKLSVGNPLSE